MDCYHPRFGAVVDVEDFVQCEGDAHDVERREAREKHKKDEEDSELGLRLSLAVVAPGVSEGLQDLQGDADVAEHDQDADEPEEGLHRYDHVLVKGHTCWTFH